MQDESNLRILDISDILPNRFQPRIKFDDEKLEGLAKSIDRFGVIEPIVVRPIGRKYEIIAGERRFKASKLVSKSTIPAIIINLSDKDSEELALLENVQRQSLSPIEEAAQYKRILDSGYITREQLSQKIGKPQTVIFNKIKLLSLSDEVQSYLLDGKISERHARSLLKLSDLDEQVEMLHRIVNERLTVKATDREIRKIIENKEDFDEDTENLFEDERGIDKMDIDKIMKEAKDINTSSVEEQVVPDLMAKSNDIQSEPIINEELKISVPTEPSKFLNPIVQEEVLKSDDNNVVISENPTLSNEAPSFDTLFNASIGESASSNDVSSLTPVEVSSMPSDVLVGSVTPVVENVEVPTVSTDVVTPAATVEVPTVPTDVVTPAVENVEVPTVPADVVTPAATVEVPTVPTDVVTPAVENVEVPTVPTDVVTPAATVEVPTVPTDVVTPAATVEVPTVPADVFTPAVENVEVPTVPADVVTPVVENVEVPTVPTDVVTPAVENVEVSTVPTDVVTPNANVEVPTVSTDVVTPSTENVIVQNVGNSSNKDISTIVADAFMKYGNNSSASVVDSSSDVNNLNASDTLPIASIPDTDILNTDINDNSQLSDSTIDGQISNNEVINPVNNTIDSNNSSSVDSVKKFSSVVKMLRDCADQIERMGYVINVDEMDVDNQYKVVFTINKD